MQPDLPLVPDGTVKNVCKIGQGASCCRYLVVGNAGLECAKCAPTLKSQLDGRVAMGLFTAIGDNCAGLPYLARN